MSFNLLSPTVSNEPQQMMYTFFLSDSTTRGTVCLLVVPKPSWPYKPYVCDK